MAKKTVINRACKTPINSSTDAFLIEDEFEAKENKIEDVAHEIVNDTASEPIVFFSDEPIQLVDLKNESAIKQNPGF